MINATKASTTTLLHIYGYYRLFVAIGLTSIFWLQGSDGFLGERFPELFSNAVLSYLILSLIAVRYLQQVPIDWQRQVLFGGFLFDTTFLVIALHTSAISGVTALSLLCVITVASAARVLGNPLALVVASLFVLGLLTDGLVSQGYPSNERIDLYNSGLFSAFLMLTAVVVNRFAGHLRFAEQEADKSRRDKATAEKLNRLILQQLNTGVILLENDEIIALNEGAEKALNITSKQGKPKRLPPIFHEQYLQWLDNSERPRPNITTGHDQQEWHLQFKVVESGKNQYTMLFIENAQNANRQAQQLKLVSLGRLTASIAHEIRNPLAAIKHAAELMQETCKVDEDKRLLEIINHQTLRMNKIVENIQSLSRKQSSPRQEIELAPWLTKWCDHVNPHYGHQLKLHIDTPNAVVNFDPSQLQQVIENLCQNALRYTVQQADGHGILLHLQYVERLQRYSLAVIDYGEPVPSEQVAHLFEPFFTTDKKGTGLGLYICRELCLSNQAALDYRCGGRRRKSFSILFAKF